MMHVELGMDEFCSACNERAVSKLLEFNKEFEGWVLELEDKYSSVIKSVRLGSADFSELLKERKHLRQRCLDVGNKLPLKQKQFERYDYLLEHYDSDLRG